MKKYSTRPLLDSYGMDDCKNDDIVIVIESDTNKSALFNRDGKQLTEFKYEDIHGFYNYATEKYVKDIFSMIYNNKYGLIDNTGTEIVPPVYDKITTYFSNSIIVANNIHKKYKYGVIDEKGKEIIPIKYDKINRCDDDNNIIKLNLNNKYGLANLDGTLICNCIYEDIYDIKYDKAIVKLNHKYGVLNTNTGKIMIPITYDKLHNFEENHILTMQNNKWGLLNNYGKEIIPCKYYSEFDLTDKYNEVRIRYEGWGLIDSEGKEILPCKYYEYPVHTENPNDIIFVCNDTKNNKYFTFDNGKKIDLNDIFDIKADDFDDDDIYDTSFIYESVHTKKYGIMDIYGNVLAEPIYDNIDEESLSYGVYIAEKNNKYGYIDKLGHQFTPLKYNECDEFKCDSAAIATDKKNIYIIDRDGHETICNHDEIKLDSDDDYEELCIYYDDKCNKVLVESEYATGYLEDIIKLIRKKYYNRTDLETYYTIMRVLSQYINLSTMIKLNENKLI